MPADAPSPSPSPSPDEVSKDTPSVKRAKSKAIEVADRPDDVTPQVWDDFIRLRKKKGAPVTDTVLSRIRAEADKAGWTMENALAECVTRGWQGFKADWVAKEDRNGRPDKKSGWDW